MTLGKTTFAAAALVLGCLAQPAAAAVEPYPADFCVYGPGNPAEGMSLTVAYGILLGERFQSDQMDQESFREALMSFQNVNRLMVEGESEAACMLLGELEDQYDLPRPDLSQPGPYQNQVQP